MSDVSAALRKFRESHATQNRSNVVVDAAVVGAIAAQIDRHLVESEQRYLAATEEARESASSLETHAKTIELALAARERELSDVNAKLQQECGKLQERSRETDELRTNSARAIADAEERAVACRNVVDQLQFRLARAEVELAALPQLTEVVTGLRHQLAVSTDNAIRSARNEAVAIEQSKAYQQRAEDSACREAKTGAQLETLQVQLIAALNTERKLRDDLLKQAGAMGLLEAKCAALQKDLERRGGLWLNRRTPSQQAVDGIASVE